MGEIDFVTSAVSTATNSFTTFITGLGSGVLNAFNTLFVTADGNVSNLAAWGLMFLGFGFASRMLGRFTRKAG